ncbi:unnamed protein product [Rotaria sp. Silwood1]|nr:unnamed protein product [Rotaria sp. Silwood1]
MTRSMMNYLYILFIIILVDVSSNVILSEYEQCNAPLGMELGLIADSDLTSSSTHDVSSVGPQMSRIRIELEGGAWCPNKPIGPKSYEYVQIELHKLHFINAIETQGRFDNGHGNEYAEYYQIEYQRESNTSHWITYYNKKTNKNILKGNVNTYTAEKRFLSSPIIAKRIRIIPYSPRWRTVCGVISYTTPPSIEKDHTYDGGVGILTDGIIGNNENTRLAWNNSPVLIKFHFDTFRIFNLIRIYSMKNKYRSIQIKFDNNLPIKYQISPIETSLSTIFVDTIQLNKSTTMPIGKRMEILFEFDNEPLLLTEITFDNEPTMLVNTTLTTMTTTVCPMGPFSTEFNMNYLLTDIDFNIMTMTADDMALIFNEFILYRVRSDFEVTCFKPDRRPKTSTSKSLSIYEWTVNFAPSPKNIIWKNIPMSEASHWFRVIVVNIILVFFMIFLTTPSIVMSTIDKIANKYRSIDPLKRVTKQIHFPVVLTSVMPVLLLRIFAAAMPSLVSITSLLEKQWKKSALDKSMMIKLFVFLSMMILILPSLGLTSIEGFLRWVFESEEGIAQNSRIRWMCMFLPDNGAFFVNYIITSAFIGAAIELLRLADLVFYIYIIITAKSTAERRVIRHALQFPFRFGVQYAWTSAVFCVIVAYAVACPLITPIGLIYMLIKRAVDKYNLVFVYDTEIADKSVHRLAGNFIIIALIIQQLTLLFFVLVRSETLTYLSMTLLSTFILTSGIYFGFSCFDCCGRWSVRKQKLSTAVLPETGGNRQKMDDLGELEEMEGRETKQRATSHYIPTILNACIEEFDIPPSTTKVRRCSIREPLQQGTYGTLDQVSQPIVVGTGDENDLLTD